jgi:hypothetical protein
MMMSSRRHTVQEFEREIQKESVRLEVMSTYMVFDAMSMYETSREIRVVRKKKGSND